MSHKKGLFCCYSQFEVQPVVNVGLIPDSRSGRRQPLSRVIVKVCGVLFQISVYALITLSTGAVLPIPFSKCTKQGYLLRIISGRFLLPYLEAKESVSLTYVLLRRTACCLVICYLIGLAFLFAGRIYEKWQY
jgi:hypothetical protein